MTIKSLKSGDQLSRRSILIWRIVQVTMWLLGGIIFFYLVFFPKTGLHLLWNVLIPVAPALMVIAPGLWRNLCPMAANSLLPRHLNFSQKRKLTVSQTGKLNLLAVISLTINCSVATPGFRPPRPGNRTADFMPDGGGRW